MTNIKIYKITSPQGKVYVGQSNNIEVRLNNYKYYRCKQQTYLYNSLTKYKWENHNIEILFENLTREDANIEEMKLIKYYKELNISLNIANGGYGGNCRFRAVSKFSLDGVFIKHYDTIKEASIILNIDRKSINDAVKNKTHYSGNYLWIYKEEYEKGGIPIRDKGIGNSRSVFVYDKNKVFLKEFQNIREASKEYLISETSISNNLNKRAKSAGGKIFKYKNKWH